MAEFLENVLAFFSKQELLSYQQPLAEEWGFLCVFNQKSKFFVVKKNSGLHKRKLLKYHSGFPNIVLRAVCQEKKDYNNQ